MSDRKRILERVEGVADTLEGQLKKHGVKSLGYGLCDHCTNFRLVKREFGGYYAECRDYYYDEAYFRPSRENPVTECSCFWDKRWKTFGELKDEATLIDPSKKKPGFKT